MKDFLGDYYDVGNCVFRKDFFDYECINEKEEKVAYSDSKAALKRKLENYEGIDEELINQLGEIDFTGKFVPVEFSNQIKTKRTKAGKKTVSECKDIINKLIKRIKDNCEKTLKGRYVDRLEGIQSKLNRIESEYLTIDKAGELFDDIDESIRGCMDSTGMSDLDKEVKGALVSIREIPVEYVLLGEYDPKKERIVLYLKAICQEWHNKYDSTKVRGFRKNAFATLYRINSDITVTDVMMSVYAHEMFHALHFQQLKARGNELRRRSYADDVVLESLADSFKYFYIKRKLGKSQLAKSSFAGWSITDISYWPYAGAQYLMLTDKDDVDSNTKNVIYNLRELMKPESDENWIFKQVFKDSLKDMKLAYYDIDKLKEIIERVN